MNRSFSRVLLIVGVAFYSLSSASQTSTLASLSKSPELERLTRRAGLIFTGTVVAIGPIRGRDSDQISSVEVTFQVEQALRGPRAGQRFSIREWPGLWVSGERYRVGQRMTIFLYRRAAWGSPVPSAEVRAGLTSIVTARSFLSRSTDRFCLVIPRRLDRAHRLAFR